MKDTSPKKFAGIWIDHHEAQLITTSDNAASGEFTVVKKIKTPHHSNPTGNENAHQQQVRAERNKYMETVKHELLEFDDILIFGPGVAQEELFNHMTADKHFKDKKLSIDTADSLTENQLIAKVRDHFKS